MFSFKKDPQVHVVDQRVIPFVAPGRDGLSRFVRIEKLADCEPEMRLYASFKATLFGLGLGNEKERSIQRPCGNKLVPLDKFQKHPPPKFLVPMDNTSAARGRIKGKAP